MNAGQQVVILIAAALTVTTVPGEDGPEPRLSVKVQPVRLALDDGSEPVAIAAHFDTDVIAQIWSAAGLEFSFLPPLQLNNSDLYDLTLKERDTVMERKPEPVSSLMNSVAPGTIVAIFVNELSDSCACQRYNGWGNIPGTLLIVDTDGSGDPSIGAAVLAHELGHNLSLKHTTTDGNLMNAEVSPWTVTLTPSQIADARETAEALAAGILVSRQPTGSHTPKANTIPGDYEMWFHEGQFFVRFRGLRTSGSYTVHQSADMRLWNPSSSFTAGSDEHLWIHTPPEQSRRLYYLLEDKGDGDGNEPKPDVRPPKVITKPK